jgi:Arc/MetJ-type ribon-helix-helix transcriptional regulator
MTKRLQVLLDETELAEIQRAARGRRQSVAEWVRGALRQARAEETGRSPAAKLQTLRASTTHAFPTGPIDQLLDEIERGYRGSV